MIHRCLRAVARILGSAWLALGLLVFIGIWSMAATAIPQGAVTAAAVAAWAAKQTMIEPLVDALGLHGAFSAPVFNVCVTLLALSTAVCSWRRVRASLVRSRMLRAARSVDRRSLEQDHDVEVACHPLLATPEALSAAAAALSRLGIKTDARDGMLRAVSRPWTVWGSPVFHVSLLALIVVTGIGTQVRSEGSMALGVGETKADRPASYVSVAAGPWYDWGGVHRAIRLDAFDPSMRTDGLDRGAVPTVSVLDGSGAVLVAQQVYPNMMLHSGSLSINAPACGLAVSLAIIDPTGAEASRLVQYVDFSQTATDGTIPVQPLMRKNQSGQILLKIAASVPLDRAPGGGFGEWIPDHPAARVRLTDGQGVVLLDGLVSEGRDATITGGGAVRLLGIGWYSRLSLVDDPTIPFVYAAMVLAMLGLAVSVASSQRVLVASVLERAEGSCLVMNLRLWRNNPASREEIESALVTALGGESKSEGAQRPGSAKE